MDGEVALILNGRAVKQSDLLNGTITGRSPFEVSLLAFAQLWLANSQAFDVSTSGSTGKSKTIALQRAQLEGSASLTNAVLGLTSSYTSLVCLDVHYIAGIMMMVRSFLCGMPIIATEPSANPFIAIPPDQRIDFAALVPYQVRAILESAQAGRMNELSVCIIGGSELDATTTGQLKEMSGAFYATFGMTETISHIALRRLNGPGASDCFSTLPGVAIGTDERGCLHIRAPYLKGTVVTNDLIEMVNDHQFRWKGRWDHVINSGGIKVSPELVEDRLQTYLADTPFFITALPDEKMGEAVTLFVQDDPWSEQRIKYFKSKASSILSKYEAPRRFVFIPRFEYTPSGKIDRKKTVDGARTS